MPKKAPSKAGATATVTPLATAKSTTANGLSPSEIGDTAGQVWGLLNEKGAQSLTAIKKSLSTSNDLCLAAIGWLAREEKLDFENRGRSIYVSLR